MAYTEPGIIVRTELENAGVVVQSADQDTVLVGELYEVFDDTAAVARYNANVGGGSQTFAWPGKKSTSVVDLAGVRSDTAEPDAQLREAAEMPMVVKLQDPITLVKITLNPQTDIEVVGQSGFNIVEGVTAAVAKTSGANATTAESGKIRRRIGGFTAAGVKIGDKIRITFAHNGPVSILATVTAISDTELTYSTASGTTVDLATMSPVDVDAGTTPNHILSAAGGFTAGATVGDRLAIWTEAMEVDDGNGTTANVITSAAGLTGLTSADIGRKITIHSNRPADAPVTAANGVSNGTSTYTSASITAAHKGRVIKISGGTASITATYRRILTAGSGTCTVSGAVLPAGTGSTFIIYTPIVRTITSVTSANSFGYSGTSLADAAQTTIPVVLHTKNLRDVTVKTSDTDLTYGGVAVTSTTGFLLNLPVDLFKEDSSYSIFPDYKVLVSYRALDTTLSTGVRVAVLSDITNIGLVDKRNPLLFAAGRTLAAMGTDDRNILLVGVNPWGHQVTKTGLPGDRDEVTAYSAALELLANDPQAYFLVPLTRNSSVRDAFATHVVAMSQPLEKRERVCFLSYALPEGTIESTSGGIEPGDSGGNKKIFDTGKGFVTAGIVPGMTVVVKSPAAYAGTFVVNSATTDDVLVLDGANWTITPEFSVSNASFDAVAGQVTSATTNIWKDVDVGDWIVSGVNYRRVTAKVNNQTLAYTGGNLTGTAQTVAVVRSALTPREPVVYYVDPLSKAEQAAALKGIAQSRANFRAVHVWPDVVKMVTGTDKSGNDIVESLSSVYLAAAEAGRLSVLPPENSSTGAALAGVSGLDHSNTYFSTSQLNTIAEGGWTVFQQPTPGGNVECRHLMSTDRSSIKRQELSVTKNVDNQAKVLRNSLKPSLNNENGRKNITPAFLNALMLPLQGILKFFVSEDQLVVGPNGEAPFKIRKLIQSPDQLDTVLAEVETTQPIPCNTVDITYVI